MNCVLRILGNESSLLNIEYQGKTVPTFVCPTGVDKEKISLNFEQRDPKLENLLRSLNKKTLILGIDSSDHMRGIKHKLRGFQRFLSDYPEYEDQILLIQVIIPDIDVEISAEAAVMELVKDINSCHGSIGNPSITLYYQNLTDSEYYNLLRAADIYLNTTERDSIPGTVLDYILCQEEKKGQVIISEFVALASNLEYAFRVNPWDRKVI
jgi:trehalose-6-phosphate synthase